MKPKRSLLIFCFTILVKIIFSKTLRETNSEENIVSASTLRLVHILHRHGDRSQIRPYTNDIYNESSWPQGYGQLSKCFSEFCPMDFKPYCNETISKFLHDIIGMSQTHELGMFLRRRYIDTGFLNPEYKRTEVYARSTDMDRTLMSAYCVLSGMFPPDKNQSWNSSIAWQPIPVHTAPLDNDPVLYVYGNCPVFNTKTKEAHKKNSLIKDVMERYKDEYKYISEHSGEPYTWEGIGNVLDPLFCQHANNYTLPDWVDNHTMTLVPKLRDLYSKASRMEQTYYAYLVHGPLLGEIIDHMVNVSSGENTLSQKFFEYSAHDTNVAGLLITMGVFNDRQPPYRSCIIIELHEPVKNKFVVKMLYRNESDHDPYPLKLKHCDLLCPLDRFQQIMKSSIPHDIDRECGRSVIPSTYHAFVTSGPVAVIAGILTIILLLAVILGAFLCCRHRNKIRESHDYTPVPLELS